MPADSVSRGDSNESGNESNLSDYLMGSSPGTSNSLRIRNDSENSEKMMRFVLPSVDGSPPKVLTINEVASVVGNIKNMELAHEIALNPEFKFQPYQPPEDSLEQRIKNMMHKAFWDILREELQQAPPNYDHAMELLDEIRECFSQIVSPNDKHSLEKINEVLDQTVIKQQAEKGVLDFKSYANFVIQIMAKSCAPARDEAVQDLTKIDDVVDMFRGILDTMQLMKLDMANYLLDCARNTLVTNSVEYEKKKFQEYLEYYKFGFPATENWLKRNRTIGANNVPCTIDQTISNAYMEFMDWNLNKEFPEIFTMDKERILKLGQRAKRLCLGATLISICYSVPVISQRSENRIALSKQIEILLQDLNAESDISKTLENIWEQIRTVLNEFLQKEQQPVLDKNTEELLKTQVMQAGDRKTPVHNLMWTRLCTYFRLALRSKAGLPPPPPGFFDYKNELEAYAVALKRVISYNHSVFGDYLHQVLAQQPAQEFSTTVEQSAVADSSSSADTKN